VSRVIDRVGRRVVSLRGIVGMAFGLACLSASAAWDARDDNTAVVVAAAAAAAGRGSAPSWLALVGIFAYRVSFSCSLGPVPYVVAAEVFANEVRAEGASVSAAANWGANAVVTGSFLWMLDRVGAARTWGAYLGACALAYVVVDRTLEETKGKTLESRGEGEGEGD
jgi:MFS family permease